MSSSVEKSPGSKNFLSSQNITYLGVAWGVSSLFFFLLFSITAPGEDSPLWYLLGTYVLELTPFLIAAILCIRNCRNPQIASGRSVWLSIGIGMICWVFGGIIFGVWEIYWGLDPEVSPADLFYMGFYISLGWGMMLAVLPRRLNLETWQWVTVGCIALGGIILAACITLAPFQVKQVDLATPAPLEQVNTNSELPTVILASSSLEAETQSPSWLVTTDKFLNQFAQPLNFVYIIADVGLLITASTLLLAFWGGRFSRSWRMIAAATIALYIADMWFKYAYTFIPDYEDGGLLEVFYVFSGVLFAIGAAFEFDISSRPVRSRGRRRRGA